MSAIMAPFVIKASAYTRAVSLRELDSTVTDYCTVSLLEGISQVSND